MVTDKKIRVYFDKELLVIELQENNFELPPSLYSTVDFLTTQHYSSKISRYGRWPMIVDLPSPAMTHAEDTLLEVLREVAVDQGYHHHQISHRLVTSGGANYTSKLYLATISSLGKPDLKLFAKIGCFSEKIRAQVNAQRLYRTENLIYTKVAKIWDSVQEKYRVPDEHRFVIPKYYGGNLKTGSETVVLEDLVAAGYGSYDRFKSVDWEHAAKSIESLAKFHALSFIMEKDDPEKYASFTEQLQFEVLSEDESVKEVWMKMVGGAVQSLDEELRGKVAKCFETCDYRKIFIDFKSPRGKPILAHGDYRPSNLMFKRQGDNLHALPIDYQTVHTGCPVSDFIYFVVTGTDEEFRSHHYQRLVDHYHQTLGEELQRYQMDVEEVYPITQFQEDLKELLPAALLLGAMILPVVVVEAESAPRTDDAGIEGFVVKPTRLFAERLAGLVRDLIRWNVI